MVKLILNLNLDYHNYLVREMLVNHLHLLLKVLKLVMLVKKEM
tara:strand:+ start:354 stop:482 length:129 start_codon:yes stop_codon:yes gene_type:complete